MLRYRDLLRVEQLFRQAKAVLATRPIYHSRDMAIRGHVFCSFLALLLVKQLEDRLHRHNNAAEWDDIRRDLDRLQEIECHLYIALTWRCRIKVNLESPAQSVPNARARC